MQQPEALDSKTCSTFPVMAGSSFVRMSDGQVLPLQLLIFFFVLVGLIERPAQHIVTAASGPQAEPLALPSGTARLRVTCILNAASG